MITLSISGLGRRQYFETDGFAFLPAGTIVQVSGREHRKALDWDGRVWRMAGRRPFRSPPAFLGPVELWSGALLLDSSPEGYSVEIDRVSIEDRLCLRRIQGVRPGKLVARLDGPCWEALPGCDLGPCHFLAGLPLDLKPLAVWLPDLPETPFRPGPRERFSALAERKAG